MRIFRLLLIASALTGSGAGSLEAGTFVSMKTPVGSVTLELYDQDKPITVANFLRYIREGRFANTFVQRWEAKTSSQEAFVIQGGGYYVQNNNFIEQVPTYGSIQNEYNSGTRYSNTYGTIAMARVGGQVNSATSQWFINLKDNSFLDNVDQGFTVFGRVVAGMDVINKFRDAPDTTVPPIRHGLYVVDADPRFPDHALKKMAALKPQGQAGFDDLVYTQWLIHPPIEPQLKLSRFQRVVSWPSLPGLTNTVQFSDTIPPQWQTVQSVLGTGQMMSVTNIAVTPQRFYRVKVDKP